MLGYPVVVIPENICGKTYGGIPGHFRYNRAGE